VSTRPTKKQRERALLETFLRVMGLNADIVERESPDFELSDKGIGVEVTELHQAPQSGETPLQAITNTSREIVERAERLHRESGGGSLRVSVAFSPNANVHRVRRDEAAKLLLDLVQRTLHRSGDVVEWRPTYKEDVRLAELFARIHIYRQPAEFTPHWLVVAAGWVAPLTADLIQSRIDDKARRVASYLRALPEVWLIIGVRGDGPSQFFDFNTGGLQGVLKSPFQRTYFLDAFLGRVLELRTTP
jgi:hypothetical protein